jgi:DNA-binding NarL/FixJ family response regulator
VLILTMHDSEQLAREVLEAGARAFLLKTDAKRHLLAAVEALGQHQPFFASKVSTLVLDAFLHPERRAPKSATPGERLTAREREIVQLVAEGKTSKEIAAELGVSLKTVEAHRSNILRKLRLRSASELVLYAVRNKIVQA